MNKGTSRRGFFRALTGILSLPVLAPLEKLLPKPSPIKYGELKVWPKGAPLGEVSYNVRFTFGPRPGEYIRLRNIKVPDENI